MANENYFFVGSETSVQLQGVRDEDGNLLDETATITGSILDVGGIVFDYEGGGNFTGIVPDYVELLDRKEYTLRIVVEPPSGTKFTIGVTRRAKFLVL